jgi:hypothetical protein
VQTRALVVSLFFVLPGSLLAQDTPFRAGQWGAQFTGGSFSSLGVVKFRSATRALVLDVHVGGVHQEHFIGDSLDVLGSNASINVRVGRRSYRSVADRVVAQHTFGVAAGFDHSVSTSPGFGTFANNGWSAGPFAELGAAYLITPHLAVGATGGVSVTYGRNSGRGSTGVRTHTWFLGGNTLISFSLTLFF